ncbi:MAG: intradiol ring-cleavage dioxygenase, partial [Pseudomonadota bacterium]
MQPHHHNEDHHRGLAGDLETLARQTHNRRQLLAWLGAGAAFPLVGCGGGGSDSGTTSTTTTSSGSSSVAAASTSSSTASTSSSTTSTTSSSCSTIPSETAGPYPGDGTNSANGSVVNALTLSGIVRSNIVTSVASASGTAAGIPLTITLKVVNTASSCASLAGFAVYLWHCDATGKYSMYDIATENYLRGVQVTNSSGEVTFTTIFPGCYSGRWPHMHFEVYSSLASATSGNNDIK